MPPILTESENTNGPAREEEAPILSVRNLKTYYYTREGTIKAVDGATFDLHRGKTLGVVGESGCGKSVTARSILRIVDQPGRIVDGEILWRHAVHGGAEQTIDLVKLDPEGKQIRGIRGAEIALIFQEPMTSFSPVHTIGDQVGEAIRIHQKTPWRETRDRVIELLRRVGVPDPEHRVDVFPSQLSGGLRQRAMIAMALACEPQLLIADEPTTALDVTTQAQILDLLRSLQEQNHMAIMLITHNLGVVAEVADEVVVMYLGRVVEQGPVDAIFYEPKHPYTQALLRSIPSLDAPPRVMLPALAGSIPHPSQRPKGCPFHPRCPSRMAGVCEQDEPELRTVGKKHQVSCFLYPQPEGAEQ